ncbi:ABC transporter [Chlamydia pneumoniae TW-183]|uniref:Probable metal transport system ATP-binding protein CPn_0348/CP_0412/CPj0348/CpB0355 n=2 Tax=Chlamydia pneumoniae TaxID=83558 RepID=Y348_CHLPN|nr:metal ABC transporter ATP-binding protein [Chlamydia pneumoniae]Q9Z8J5.1 RecName: Full=Probable metal transport system ATP-binding protein CPn_0348/CP_0412/CPj0348/CpB0355 [Chlamydia pneumoniae]AAD18492.1 rRNA methylase [Chlamydia pneumoniae CWL029]AAF38256.1 ABC transporter, ATP-binding protein [Chlamydia pneumoniae AR39]AAP98286.1 ABC transporter [Chlamydia pneumoniae TW-183]CRI32847.1 Probable metal transport system ATP-binding protein CPn_0348/CP_0412/CPj0348/CpB0355 [Chlamydia pneumoni
MNVKDETFWSVHNLCVNYEHAAVLYHISFSLGKGSLTAILGPNGAGKSTLLKASLGLIKPSSGTVYFFNQKFKKVRQRIAYMPQRASVDWDFPMTVLDLALMGCYSYKGMWGRISSDDRREAFHILERVGLESVADRQIGQLSGGQQQRAFLARALMQKADLYLMDELFSAIDMASFKTSVGVLQELRDQGKTIVVVHHDLSHVRQLFDHVVLLNKRLICCGPTDECLNGDTIFQTYGCEIELLEQTLKLSRGKQFGSC